MEHAGARVYVRVRVGLYIHPLYLLLVLPLMKVVGLERRGTRGETTTKKLLIYY